MNSDDVRFPFQDPSLSPEQRTSDLLGRMSLEDKAGLLFHQLIVAGDLHERLPHRTADDPFSKLAMVVNGMLDEMETLVHSLAGVGNNIAHDLRTPLTRVRLTLERGRSNAKTLEQLQTVADKTIDGLDQSLSIITAILRLAEIENSQRMAGFGKVALTELVREVGDM